MGDTRAAQAIMQELAESKDPAALAKDLQLAIIVGLAERTGEPRTVWNGREGTLCPTPSTGAVLHVRYAVSDYSYDDWYPSVTLARAALRELAMRKGVEPDDGGMSVDMTSPGCHTSDAYIREVGEVRGGTGRAAPMAGA